MVGDFPIDRVLNVLGLLSGLLGIALSVVLYRRGLRGKELRWALYGGGLPRVADSAAWRDFGIPYRENSDGKLHFARIAFWNSGRETVRRKDLVAGDPFRIQSSDDAVLSDVSIVATTSIHNRVKVDLDEVLRAVLITFEYLDPREGAIVQFVTASPGRPEVLGRAQGVPAIAQGAMEGGLMLYAPTRLEQDLTLTFQDKLLVNRLITAVQAVSIASWALIRIIVPIARTGSIESVRVLESLAIAAISLFSARDWLLIWARHIPPELGRYLDEVFRDRKGIIQRKIPYPGREKTN